MALTDRRLESELLFSRREILHRLHNAWANNTPRFEVEVYMARLRMLDECRAIGLEDP